MAGQVPRRIQASSRLSETCQCKFCKSVNRSHETQCSTPPLPSTCTFSTTSKSQQSTFCNICHDESDLADSSIVQGLVTPKRPFAMIFVGHVAAQLPRRGPKVHDRRRSDLLYRTIQTKADNTERVCVQKRTLGGVADVDILLS
jgi:hypothetical protein